MSELVAVFARAPELGKVKTRLTPPLTADEALALHTALVADTLDHVSCVERPGLERLLLLSQPLVDPQDLHVPEHWSTGIQSSGDLGARMAAVFYTSFRRGVNRMIVLGSDSPTLPLEVIHEALDELERKQVVIGPAEDGGYYLLGCSEWIPEIFQNIAWGTSEVLEQTTRILGERNITYSLLIPWYDIDRSDDLEKLREEIQYLRRSAPDLVPVRVAAVLPDAEDSEYSLDTDF